MASCKGCLHYDVCEARIAADENYPERNYTENNNCSNFKDRSKFVELPVQVGERCAIRRKNFQGKEVHEYAILKEVNIIVHNHIGDIHMSPENVMTVESMMKLEAEKALKESSDA